MYNNPYGLFYLYTYVTVFLYDRVPECDRVRELRKRMLRESEVSNPIRLI